MKTVLITGISKGIGKALAQKFLSEGWQVLGTVLTGTAPEQEHLTSFPLDLSSPDSIAACTKAIAASGAHIDVLVNNAGALFDEDDTVVIADKLRKTLEVNVIGTADFTEHIIGLMGAGAHIVNIASTAGSLWLASYAEGHHPGYYPSYRISKAALNMYTRTLAQRLKPQDITVSSVHPGWVKTDMGGEEADIPPEEAARSIYELATSQPETGQFWFNGKKLPW